MAETTAALIRDGKIPPTILVGIWNTGALRHSEYFPEKVLPFLPQEMREKFVRLSLNGKPSADNYLRFIVQELKPAIDTKYATLPDKKHTIVMITCAADRTNMPVSCARTPSRACASSRHFGA